VSDEDQPTGRDGDPPEDRANDDAVDEWVAAVADEADDGGDPFEKIGEGSGPRHGDPFDAFEDAGDSPENATTEGEPADGTAPEDVGRPDPARDGLPSGLESDAPPGESGGPTDRDADDPFTTFDEPGSDPFGEGDSVFERVEASDVDDGVWERMESSDPDATAVPGKRYVDVNKHSYCETCEYFSEPPAVACSHEGTEILEFVDMDTVRVSDCPVVAKRKAIEDDE